jgi:type I restriction enzyme M protein
MPQNIQQREELHKTIWAIANSLRGAIDGWEFKSYVLCSIFYRFISENMQHYIDHLQELAGVKGFDYSQLDDKIAETVRTQMVQEKGYFILPSQLFCNVCKTARKDENLNLSLQNTFRAIEASAQGTPSEDDVRGLFSDFAVNNSQLGQSVQIRNQKLADVLIAVRDMDLKTDNFEDNEIDTFGDTYEFLMKMYASNAGKSGGEFYTPQEVSELLAELASINNDHIDSVYDPACGSGSLLMKFSKTVGKTNPELKYYGQEINPTTYNLCRINMFLHNINFSNFDIKLGDTLLKPMHKGLKFDAIVSNPPYSLPWIGKENPLLINDERYAPASVLAPKQYSDLAFTMHMLSHLKETGTCAIVEFPGVLYRGRDEQKIRQYLVSNNYVDTVIQLPENLFFGVPIATCIIVLKKSAKRDSSILFIDASKLFDKVGNKNVLSKKYREQIAKLYIDRKDVDYLSKLVPNDSVLANKSTLTVSAYVEKEDKREKIDIVAICKRLKQEVVPQGAELRKQVDEIMATLQ